MRLGDADIRPYEGLVISTAALLVNDVDDEFDDIAQTLRLTVARALVSYDITKARQTVEKYVFQCVFNRRKDIGSRKRRPEESLDAHLEGDDVSGRTEAKYLSCDEVNYAVVEDQPVRLPSTLTQVEVDVIVLSLRDFNQTEVARELGLTRQRVRDAQRTIRLKLERWRPDREVAVPRPVSHLPHRSDRQTLAA